MPESVCERVGERAYRCYRELISFVEVHGYVPSYAELGQRLGRAPSTVGRYLDALEEEGLIERVGRQARSLVIKVQDEGPRRGTNDGRG
jgi:DNA-binding MarR family transcriptional regulator